jgi:ABC-2 type transport system ATP-binding protein
MTTTRAPRLAVKTVGLRKSFGEKVVLDGIDLHVEEGTIFALLGPNGAGKTTTVHILSTLIRADGGKRSRRPRPPETGATSTSRRSRRGLAGCGLQ